MAEQQVKTPVSIPVIVTVGILAGFLSGMFGVGGGILIVPGLVIVARMDQRLAHGTSLAAVLPIVLSTFFTYLAHDHIDWPVVLWLAIGGVGGALLGTKLLHVLPHKALALGFSGLLLLTAARLFMGSSGTGRASMDVAMAASLTAVGLATGILAGLLGVGGGVVMVPAMMVLFSIPPVIAKGTSAGVMIVTSITGTIRNRKNDNADMRSAVILGCSGILAAIAGGWIAARMDDTVSNVLFASLLVVVAVRLLLEVRSSH
ncbi:MAG: sulfite exporter TauE/SafE family protein [Actinomycetota bacterium]